MSDTPQTPAVGSALLTPATVDDLEHALHDAVTRLADHLRAVSRPSTGPEVDAVRATVAALDLDGPGVGLPQALTELGPAWMEGAMHFHHPRYVAHLNCPVTIPSLAAEILVSGLNSSLDTWDQSGGGTHIEQAVIDWTCARLGLAGGDGVMTPGGTTSNLQALLLARGEALAAGARQEDLRVVVSPHGHFSIARACHLMGLSPDALVAAPLDEQGRLSPAGVAGTIERLRGQGLAVMAVVATAGTTDLGIIDPLHALGTVCRDAGVWLHVDAAYGGGLAASARHGHRLRGTALADSVTVDYHKTFFVPIGASAVLVARPQTLRHVAHHADYLNPRGAGVPNLVDKSLQTTRRFDALKVWVTLRSLGPAAIGAMMDEVIDLAAVVADHVEAADDLELAARPQLSTVVLRPLPGSPDQRRALRAEPALADEVTRRTRRLLLAEGRSVVAGTTLDGVAHLKLTLLNPTATEADLLAVLHDIRDAAGRALAQVTAERHVAVAVGGAVELRQAG